MKTTPRHIKLLKTNDKEKILNLKAGRKKKDMNRRTKIRVISDFLSEIM